MFGLILFSLLVFKLFPVVVFDVAVLLARVAVRSAQFSVNQLCQ